MPEPTFLIIGAAKAATTSLSHLLASHPQAALGRLRARFITLSGRLDVVPRDQGATEGEKRAVDIVAPFVADGEPPEPMQPSQGPFHDPAEDPEPASVRTPGFGHDRDNPLRREAGVALGGPVGAIALDDTGFAAGAAAPAGDRG